MFILRDIFQQLQEQFPNSKLNQWRSRIFLRTLLSCIMPFTDSKSSNLLRAVNHLFNFKINQRRFYTFMASSKLPWQALWQKVWCMIPQPRTEGRLMIALDDSINTKTGKKVFGCASIFDHAAKDNQSKYPWAQCITSIGLLKMIKGRWACIPLAFRFYLPKKELEKHCENMKLKGKLPQFSTKLAQAVEMIATVSAVFPETNILAVCDSWFGNNGLFKPAREAIGDKFHLLTRMRCNITLYDMPEARRGKRRGASRKYGKRHGSVTDLAIKLREQAQTLSVFIYSKQRDVLATSHLVMLKTLRCQVRIVYVYRKTQWVAMMTTDLSLSVEQIIEYYSARWKIESGFKEIKQDIGSSKSQTRNAVSVSNHLNFCMMAVAVTWIYAIRLENTPERRHVIRGRSSFAFSDVRHIIAKATLDKNFDSLCLNEGKAAVNSVAALLLRMVA